ncbi:MULTISPECIES: maleylpyruvate isomerase N-terminal domain-containing protein [unclassified Pseudonocardia]|uniref:maleylpyruvate isomerase N-terminal domain-containing protein n=1 Tax=unclassified Pseudonocardia TaxID=2619320 RepID=UPI0001FFDFCC|nr:maleylpyruvate isomerase N-terminal domain-containing protein [Pseudonocardia sp. Ae707_Ps1]OLM19837.1 Ribosomal-protein-alanine acetyltransferase [Pseudonocardia sp. Ae707_Ps1]
MRAEDVEQAVVVMTEALRGTDDADWSAPAGPLEWSCRDTAVHVADDLFGYAAQVAVAPAGDYPPFELTVPAAASVDGLILVVETGGAMLASVVRTAPPGVRGWHPYGDGDACGFAAMGVVEVLVHTHDITRGLGVGWTMPAPLCRGVLARLWPDTDPGDDPAATLLHRTGRAALNGVPPPSRWRWYGAPHT